ncbi:MAG: hypothetical protein JST81_06685 [Bacteroidetes bacterium]|nr:hypothetical protein [Bacteroidota bacterium]
MKKQIFLFVAATFMSITSLMAQEARQMPSPEERTKAAMAKIAAFDLSSEKRTKVEAILVDFYTTQQSTMREMRAAGGDREQMMEKNKDLAAKRNDKLKEIFTEEEYTKWINDIEPSLRPQRPGMAPADKKAAPEKKPEAKN